MVDGIIANERKCCSGQELRLCGADYSPLPALVSAKEGVCAFKLLRCGTSIGANVEEAIGGQSRADFVAKMSIAYKEARETTYWLRLLKDTDYLTQVEFDRIHSAAEELCRIIAAIQKSTKKPVAANS